MLDLRWMRDFVTLLVVVNPIAVVLPYVALVQDETPGERRRIALRAVSIAGAILLTFIVAGQVLLGAMGVGMSSFRIAGGLVLLVIGLRMVLDDQSRSSRSPGEAPDVRQDVSVFPLAVPFIAGPGAMLSVVLLTDNDRFSIREQAQTAGELLVVLALTYLALRLSERVFRMLGKTGVNVVTRVMGLILSSMAVEAMLAGIHGHFGK